MAPDVMEQEALRWLSDVGGQVIERGEPHWPAGFGRLKTPPKRLWARGDPALLGPPPGARPRGERRWVGVVGARNASDRGLARAARLAHALARAGHVVVSGGARGIDTAAHTGSLDGGGATVALLGAPFRAGVDERLAGLRDVTERADAHGRWCTVTPYGPDVRVAKHLFAARNRMVAALCDALVVIEGKRNSGTRYTAKDALALGVELWAIPGDPDAPLAACPNDILATGRARALLHPDALLSSLAGRRTASLSLSAGLRAPRSKQTAPVSPRGSGAKSSQESAAIVRTPPPKPEDPDQRACLAALWEAGGQLPVDALSRAASLPVDAIWGALLTLELEGCLRRSGPFVILTDRGLPP